MKILRTQHKPAKPTTKLTTENHNKRNRLLPTKSAVPASPSRRQSGGQEAGYLDSNHFNSFAVYSININSIRLCSVEYTQH